MKIEQVFPCQIISNTYTGWNNSKFHLISEEKNVICKSKKE